MSTPFFIYWNNLKVQIAASWPEVTKVFTDDQINRRDWNNEIRLNKLTAPWVVVVLDVSGTPDWGALPHQIIKPTIYYFASLPAIEAAATFPTVQLFLDDRMTVLKLAVLNSIYLGTTLNEVSTDLTGDNPGNIGLGELKQNFQCGSITFQSVTPI